MNQPIERVSKWFYQGVWGVLTKWFRVPAEPPMLPALAGESIRSLRPSAGFLRYLMCQFWIGVAAVNIPVFIGCFAIFVGAPIVALFVTPVILIIVLVVEVAIFLGIHLRYDTTWYVMSDRSIRIRRGIWIIHETTITFENVQNVTVNQGPLQRFFQIADVTVQTAGGGGAVGPGKEGPSAMAAHQGLIEGIDNAPQVRDLIMSRLKMSRSGGLGDEHTPTTSAAATTSWTQEHLAALREIRDAVKAFGVR